MIHPYAAKRIAQTLPRVKIIILLRNPVDRSYSHYNWPVKLKDETLSIEEAIWKEQNRVDGEYGQREQKHRSGGV